MQVNQGTVVVYGDLACPWASLAVHRFHRARASLGLEDSVVLDIRAFPLELFNNRPTPKHVLDKEVAAIAALEPDLGWGGWSEAEWRYPGTVLLALEAVQAAKSQTLRASEQLDLALRRAFFVGSRSIYLRSEILNTAGSCPDVDAGALAEALDQGSARHAIMLQKGAAESDKIEGSPHFFLADGSDFHNPGIEMHWDKERKEPVIDTNEPEVVQQLVERAANAAGRGG